MQMNPVGWFEIYVDDMVRAKSFYEAVFKVTLEKLDNETGIDIEMWVFPSDMDKYGATGALCSMPDVKAGGNSTMVYFSCDDCATEASLAAANGGVLQVPKMAIGQPALFMDNKVSSEWSVIPKAISSVYIRWLKLAE